MGVTIHYRGKINEVSLINNITDELNNITGELEWGKVLIDDSRLNLKGILMLPPPECEPLSFLFDKTTGILKHCIILSFQEMGEDHYINNYVKTQFAPIQVHITIIKLLKYLKNKYLFDLQVNDEGEYWETENAGLLQSKFDFLKEMTDVITGAISNTPNIPGETPEALADRIEKILIDIQEKNKNKRG